MNHESEFDDIHIQDLYRPGDLERPVTERIHAEQLRQAKITFNAALVIGVLGCLIIILGVGFFLFTDANNIGKGFTVGAGIILDVMSFFLIKFHRKPTCGSMRSATTKMCSAS